MKKLESRQSILQQWLHYLLSPCDPSNLGIFRFCFGMLMVIDIPQERGFASIQQKWESDKCYFSLFSFLKPLSYEWMHVVYVIMFLAAVGVMLGFLYRLSCFSLMICYWYLFFLDKGVWNNHSYLYGLISFMLLITDCNRYWSIDGLLFPSIRNSDIPKWNYIIFKFQVFLVYFYAGIKKLDRDWMTGYSMSGLASKWVFDPFRPFLSDENIDLYLVHIAGLCYDLFVGFFLLFDKTRLIGIIFSLMFHGMNSQMFYIGMFSYTMMASLTLFCSEKWPKTLLSRLPDRFLFASPLLSDSDPSSHCVYPSQVAEKSRQDVVSKETKSHCCDDGQVKWYHTLMVLLFTTHVGMQCFLPYSHFLTKGYNGWTEGLYGYSWDMMVHSWSTQHIRIRVVDQTNGKEIFIRPGAFIGGGRRSHSRWSSHPDMIKQYMTCLAEKLKTNEEVNITEPAIYLDIWRSLNQRFQQRFVNPNVNLVKAPWSPFAHSPWVLPLLTDLSPWREKMKEIEQNTLKTSMGNFTEIVFVADFPGLLLENFVSEDLNTTLSVLNGRVNVEINNANHTLGEGQEIAVPSNATHVVYTVSDTPACWMYMYMNTTVLNNDTLKQWVMHPETRPSSQERAQRKQMSPLKRFADFMAGKYLVFYVTFWNSYYALGHLTVGLEYPWDESGPMEAKEQTPPDEAIESGTQNDENDSSGSQVRDDQTGENQGRDTDHQTMGNDENVNVKSTSGNRAGKNGRSEL